MYSSTKRIMGELLFATRITLSLYTQPSTATIAESSGSAMSAQTPVPDTYTFVSFVKSVVVWARLEWGHRGSASNK